MYLTTQSIGLLKTPSRHAQRVYRSKEFLFCTTSRRLRTCDSLETHVLKLATFRSTHELVDSRINALQSQDKCMIGWS